MNTNDEVTISLLTQILEEERVMRKQLEEKIEQDKPFTEFGKAISASSDSISMSDFAKIICNSGINMGRTRLLEYLRDKGYLQDENEKNVPYQDYVNSGLFELVETETSNGNIVTVTLITGKGQMKIFSELKKDYLSGVKSLPIGFDDIRDENTKFESGFSS